MLPFRVMKIGRNQPCPCGSGIKFKKCCMGKEPRAVLVEEKNSNRWTIELKNFKQFCDTLGADVMNAFCRCFVWSDRLTSMISFAYVSQQHHGRDSVAFARNLQTMIWFTVGTLRELALAIKDLRAALAKRKVLDAESAPWINLRELEKRWEDDSFYREMRNVAAFHVDPPTVEKGLEALSEKSDVVLMEGEGEKSDGGSLRLGLEALFQGSTMDLADFERFVQTVSQDHGIGSTIQEAFILAVQTAGIPFGE